MAIWPWESLMDLIKEVNSLWLACKVTQLEENNQIKCVFRTISIWAEFIPKYSELNNFGIFRTLPQRMGTDNLIQNLVKTVKTRPRERSVSPIGQMSIQTQF